MWLTSSHLVLGRDALCSQQQHAAPFTFMKIGDVSLYAEKLLAFKNNCMFRLVGFKPFCIVSFNLIRDNLMLDPCCLVQQSIRAKTLPKAVKLNCCAKMCPSQSQCPRGLGRGSTVARLLGLRVRNSPGS
jgi:hypothetical protein